MLNLVALIKYGRTFVFCFLYLQTLPMTNESKQVINKKYHANFVLTNLSTSDYDLSRIERIGSG